MRSLVPLVGLMVVLFSVPRVRGQDDQYVRIYGLIQEAGSLYSAQQPGPALAKYREAQASLLRFQRAYPEWNSNIVKYRLTFLETVISEISARHPDAAAGRDVQGGGTNAIPSQPASRPAAGLESQLGDLQDQIRRLQSDNSLLESKLKEALRAQPASADPRALARAEQEVRSLQKENTLLKLHLDREPADPASLEGMEKQLAEANRKAAEATDRAAALASRAEALQKKLDGMVPSAANAAEMEATHKALETANRRLSEQTASMSRLTEERKEMEERIRSMGQELEAVAALKSENEVLKRQLAEVRNAAPSVEQDKLKRELAEAQVQIAVLQSEQNVMRLEKEKLESQLQQGGAVAGGDAARVGQLERERDDWRSRYEGAQKELASLKARGAGAKVDELQNEIQILRTRLAVMETQKVPYTEEEAALLKKTDAQLADPRAGRKSVRELPPGSVTLVAEAQQDFAARRFAQAEEKYQEVLKRDEKNVYTLANLAAIQIELGRYPEAEKHLSTALTQAPDDAYSMSLLGFLRFRQARYDDALDALGKAARLDPQNAEVQNYLGLTLSQKGMRKSAESALRKAITLDPNYGSAHYNLAVIHMMQKELELARMHYRKALAAGMPPSVDMERMLKPSPEVP